MSKPVSMWVPRSHSFRNVTAVRKRVQEYDANLSFGQNPDNGQWCIFLRHGTMEASSEGDFPILGFRDIPSPDEAIKRLHQTDALRRGREILDAVEREAERERKALQAKHDDVDGQVAEALEWAHREMGTHPVPRIFVPGKD